MSKEFNVTGTCIPSMHYMVDVSSKINKIFKFVEKGKYFTINRPRQYGKTTVLFMLEKYLSQCEAYLTISISFEGLGDSIFEDEELFVKTLLEIMSDSLLMQNEDLAKFLENNGKEVLNLKDVSKVLSKFVLMTKKKVILMIDEVDKSSNNQLFLSFLGMLRNKYLLHNQGKDETFHSVILAGVHDVKNLKLKLRSNEEQKYNSPWNIAEDFKVDMSFSKAEIATMLKEYKEDRKLQIDLEFFSDKIYFYTAGYPFLVSKLCKIIDENLMEDGNECWTELMLTKALKLLLNETNTNFDSLIKNIENNESLKDFIERIVLIGEEIVYVPSDSIISMGEMYGILKAENGRCKVNNRIYEQYIYNHLTAIKTRESDSISRYNFKGKFLTNDGGLDFEKILLSYQKFMKEQYCSRDEKFLERHGRLLYLAFIRPIINGVGFEFKEAQVSEEKRLDVVVTYNSYKYITELKIWYGEEYYKAGIEQLCDYLSINSLDKGYLVVYNFNKNKEYNSEWLFVSGKEIFVVWV